MPYGTAVERNGVWMSFHPAGYVLGASQIRFEHHDEVWVVSGDYKLEFDPTCTPFDPVRRNTFVTESTFGLPIYRWQPAAALFESLNAWWWANRDAGMTYFVYAYSLGTAQGVLHSLVLRHPPN